jgi:uncharacterized membrane protein YbhN (UPF0104 family)
MRLGLGVLMGVVALWWTGRGLEWRLVFRTLATVRQDWVLVSIVGVVAVALAKTTRWGELYRATGHRPSFGTLFSALMAAQAINLFIPVRLGELVRLVWMKQAGQPGAITLSTLLVEKALDLLSVGVMALSLVALAVAPLGLRSSAIGTLLIGLVLTFGLASIWRLRARLKGWRGLGWGSWLPDRWRGQLGRIMYDLPAALAVLAHWRSLLSVLGWTMIIWLLSLLTIVTLFAAFQLRLPVVAAVFIMLAVSTSNIVPSPPALVGVMQVIAVLILGQYGVDRPVAIGFGTVLNLVTVVPLLILGGWAISSHTVSVATWLRQHSA